MGNTCPTGNRTKPSGPRNMHPDNGRINPEPTNTYDLMKHVEEMKQYHRERLKRELQTDLEAFILDNTLMCIQFYNHFEKSIVEASEYRRDTEREMTEVLAKDAQEGMILGDRRVKLLTGMSQILAQNYIYRGENHPEDDVDELYGGVGYKDTFITEGILPLEFITSWVNFELYHPKELEQIKDYSDAKGASPSARFCMEQPDKRDEYPKGYVRLRCVDDPISHRKPLEIPRHPSSDFGYAVAEPVYSKPYIDEIPEANSESEEAVPSSGTTSDDDDSMMKMLEKVKSAPSILKSPSRLDRKPENLPSTSTAGRPKPIMPKLQLPKPPMERIESYPSLRVHAPLTPPVLPESQAQSIEDGFLFPPSNSNRILNRHSSSTPNLSTRSTHGKDTHSSGYDTTSTRSPNSSMVSEMQRGRWQRQNVKRLQEYGMKTRKDQIPKCGKYDPTPWDCYSEVKYEFPLDAPEDDDDDDEESIPEEDEDESDGEEFDFNTGKPKNNKRNVEEEYELRIYLNSVQFSSNACSEFPYIGSMLSIPEQSIGSGVVLGTTMRFPIPYTYPRDSETEDDTSLGHYYIAYTFTPALHIKSWPDNFYLHFNHQVNHSTTKKLWPSHYQMEQIEVLGCNAIPLGYRSVEFFNAEQMLEWELNFHECEINLLESFHSAHWRAYIFASLLFRAFIAPLGPQGIGLEHIRNVMYCMCFDDFYGWNDEQPGLHLKTVIEHLFECLSKENMPSFFINSRNLFQSIPPHNIRFVQAHLHQIRENILIRSIYAFRNLVPVRKSQDSYPLPDFKYLYNLLTVDESGLLSLVSIGFRMLKQKEDEEKRAQHRQKSRARRKKQQKPTILAQQEEIDKQYFAPQRENLNKHRKRDKIKTKLQKGYKNYEKIRLEELEKQRIRDREARRLKENPEHRLPNAEKRHSIDLRKEPVLQQGFPSLRSLHVIKFFIEQFLKMANTAAKFQNYSQATMYLLQIENLCEIVLEEQETINISSPFDDSDFEQYREETLRLRGDIGKDLEQYILARTSFPQTEYGQPPSSSRYPSEPAGAGEPFPSFTNNWDLRKLPTPPASVGPSGRKLEKPNIVSSLQSFDSFSNTPMSPKVPTPPMSPKAPPTDRNSPRRQESIKFVNPAPIHKDTTPPATPPPRTIPRKSPISMSLDRDDEDDIESTDL